MRARRCFGRTTPQQGRGMRAECGRLGRIRGDKAKGDKAKGDKAKGDKAKGDKAKGDKKGDVLIGAGGAPPHRHAPR
jgi:hypothetical protein